MSPYFVLLHSGSTGFSSGAYPGSQLDLETSASRGGQAPGRGFVRRQAVHDHDQRPAHVPPHLSHERLDLGSLHVPRVDREVQPEAAAAGR
jgi:hypothetical protein